VVIDRRITEKAEDTEATERKTIKIHPTLSKTELSVLFAIFACASAGFPSLGAAGTGGVAGGVAGDGSLRQPASKIEMLIAAILKTVFMMLLEDQNS
jgi:hypothetical protein